MSCLPPAIKDMLDNSRAHSVSVNTLRGVLSNGIQSLTATEVISEAMQEVIESCKISDSLGTKAFQ